MKKWKALLLLTICVTGCLTGCKDTTPEETEDVVVQQTTDAQMTDEEAQTDEEPFVDEIEIGTEQGVDVAAWLGQIRTECEIGTAGSSMEATRLAAQFLDALAESGKTKGEAASAAKAYVSELDVLETEEFKEQMFLVMNGIYELFTDNADGLLEVIGYERAYAWDGDTAFAVMEEIYDGLGFDMPVY